MSSFRCPWLVTVALDVVIAQNSVKENVPNPHHLSVCGHVDQWARRAVSLVLG